MFINFHQKLPRIEISTIEYNSIFWFFLPNRISAFYSARNKMRINSEDDFLIEQIFGWDVKKIREIQSEIVFIKRIFLREWEMLPDHNRSRTR